ncbi:hypothetical protein WA1_26240 [Scytonema hofmannii PCC 7110]|uniref:Uncharacterized protein n=1 Tax=Scytonema hofmannii PCC 7110 TaxID=128403 RepID=A0A139X7E3_9CYAN|nr:hypothetical protein [Scytonema hofmannii]KYC40618.1 hypothetical protein WA1_26240 [Scytonema hofmannii PCC 7110]
MKIQILTIEATLEKGTFKVVVLVGEKQHKFTMKVESVTVANREVQVTNGDDNFSEVFRFNQIGASDICKLVAKIYNNQVVELPADLGEFYLEKTKSALL